MHGRKSNKLNQRALHSGHRNANFERGVVGDKTELLLWLIRVCEDPEAHMGTTSGTGASEHGVELGSGGSSHGANMNATAVAGVVEKEVGELLGGGLAAIEGRPNGFYMGARRRPRR